MIGWMLADVRSALLHCAYRNWYGLGRGFMLEILAINTNTPFHRDLKQ
jgi:hypothetical protein